MSNDALIDKLVGDLRPVPRPRFGPQIGILLALAAVELAGFLALGAMRPDMYVAIGRAAFWWKMAGLALLAFIGVHVALHSFRPDSSPRKGLVRWAWALAGILFIGAVIDSAGQGLDSLAARLMWIMGVECLTVMTVLSVPPVVALGLMMRRGAPTDHPASAGAVGGGCSDMGRVHFCISLPER